MSHPQENYERAVRSASDTLSTLSSTPVLDITREHRRRLQAILWDLEAIGASIRLELMNREDVNPIDLGT